MERNSILSNFGMKNWELNQDSHQWGYQIRQQRLPTKLFYKD